MPLFAIGTQDAFLEVLAAGMNLNCGSVLEYIVKKDSIENDLVCKHLFSVILLQFFYSFEIKHNSHAAMAEAFLKWGDPKPMTRCSSPTTWAV